MGTSEYFKYISDLEQIYGCDTTGVIIQKLDERGYGNGTIGYPELGDVFVQKDGKIGYETCACGWDKENGKRLVLDWKLNTPSGIDQFNKDRKRIFAKIKEELDELQDVALAAAELIPSVLALNIKKAMDGTIIVTGGSVLDFGLGGSNE